MRHVGLSSLLLLAVFASPSRGDTLSGHVLDPSAVGIAGVDVDVFVQATGVKLKTPNDNTGVGGDFTVAVPAGTYRVTFDPSGAPGPTLAPKQVFDVVVSGATDLGDVPLEYGAVVTGQVLGPSTAGVAGADLDLVDSSTGVKAYTPGDDTDLLGSFAFVVAAGTYLVQVQPPIESGLVGVELGPVSLPPDADLGTIQLEAGARLSGRVVSPTGSGIGGVDLDVAIAGTGETVPLTNDLTDPSGGYLVVVPIGTLDVTFTPSPGSVFPPAVFNGQAVAGDAVLDVLLDPSGSDPTPTPLDLGDAFVGSFGAGNEVDEVRFEAPAGLLASFMIRRTGVTARPDLALIAPSGASVSLPPYSIGRPSGVKARLVPLPEDGVYRLLLFSLDAQAGPYLLRTKFKAPPSMKAVPSAGDIATPGQTADLPFGALAGATLRGTVLSSGSGLDPSIVALLSPTGVSVPLAGLLLSEPGVRVTILGVVLGETGTYTLRVGGTGGTTGPFGATLKVRFPRPLPLIVNET